MGNEPRIAQKCCPQTRREELFNLLGDLPNRSHSITVSKIAEEKRDSYFLEKLTLDLNQMEPVPAYFVRPLDCDSDLPAVLYNHAHGGDYDLGKEEFLNGRALLQLPPYAEQLTRLGYAALCIDTWAFGERATRSESVIFKEMLWRGQVMWGMMVYDSLRALDYLVSRPEVNPARLGTVGLSMGSTMAWWVAALDERVKVCVDICCLTDCEALIQAGHLDSHGIYYFVPRLLKHFTTAEINALIAPRPHLSLAGDLDPLTPPEGLDRIDVEVKKVYAASDAMNAWKLIRYNCGHGETSEMRSETVAFLKKWM